MLLISAGGLGDTILFSLILPRLTALAKNGERITILLRRESAKMAFLFPLEINVMAVDFGRLRHSLSYRRQAFARLFHSHYRLAVSTDFLRHPDLDDALIRATAAEESIAMAPRSWPKYDGALQKNRRLYNRLYDSGPVHLDKVVRWARFADWITATAVPPPVVRLPADLIDDADPPEPADVLIQPFSAIKLKQSPPALYRRIIDSFPKGTRIAITGTPGDLDNNPEFKPLLDIPNITFDASTFIDLAPKLKAARLVISVDTALMHLAIALGAPTIGLASAAYVGEIVPYAEEITPNNAHIQFQPMDCQGCLGACHLAPVNGMYPCVALIDADHVISLAAGLLSSDT